MQELHLTGCLLKFHLTVLGLNFSLNSLSVVSIFNSRSYRTIPSIPIPV